MLTEKPLHRGHRAAGGTARDRDAGGWGEPPGGESLRLPRLERGTPCRDNRRQKGEFGTFVSDSK